MGSAPADDVNVDSAFDRFSGGVWRTHRGGLVSWVITELSLATFNLCVIRRYYLSQGGMVSTVASNREVLTRFEVSGFRYDTESTPACTKYACALVVVID